MTFYDSYGTPVAYTEDDESIYLFKGNPVAYFYENKVYGYNGHHFGWYENGWVRDKNGRCVFFTENATGSGPIKPVKKNNTYKKCKTCEASKECQTCRKCETCECFVMVAFIWKTIF